MRLIGILIRNAVIIPIQSPGQETILSTSLKYLKGIDNTLITQVYYRTMLKEFICRRCGYTWEL